MSRQQGPKSRSDSPLQVKGGTIGKQTNPPPSKEKKQLKLTKNKQEIKPKQKKSTTKKKSSNEKLSAFDNQISDPQIQKDNALINIQKNEEYQTEIDQMERQIKEYKTEKQIFEYQAEQTRKQTNKELKVKQSKLTEETAQAQSLQERLDRVEKIEDAIIQLYMEMKDRSHEMHNDEENWETKKQKEKSKLESSIKKNSLVVLDDLSARLRNLLAFKESYEDELKKQIQERNNETEKKLNELKNEIAELESKKESFLEEAEDAHKTQESSEESKEKLVNDSNSLILQLKSENEQLMREIERRENSIDELYETLASRDEFIRRKETSMRQIPTLESQIQKEKIKHQFDLNKFKAQNNKTKQIFKKEMHFFKQMKEDVERMERNIQEKRKQLKQQRESAKRSKVDEQEKICDDLQKKLDGTCSNIDHYTKKIRLGERRIAEYQKKNINMKREYDHIFFEAYHTQTGDDDSQEYNPTEHNFALDEDDSEFGLVKEGETAGEYKGKLKEKEREVQDLQRKLKRMILQQKRSQTIEEHHQEELSTLKSNLNTLKEYTSSSLPSGTEDLSKDQVRSVIHDNKVLREKKRDYDNLRYINEAANEAFQSLQTERETLFEDETLGDNIPTSSRTAKESRQSRERTSK